MEHLVEYTPSQNAGINPLPQPVQGLENKNVVHIDAGDYTTCAVLDDGSAYCWGKKRIRATGRWK